MPDVCATISTIATISRTCFVRARARALRALYRSHYNLPFVIVPLPAALFSTARRFFQMNCSDVTSQSRGSSRAAGRILDAHEKPIENLFAFIERAANSGR